MPFNWKTYVGIAAALILGGCVTDERNDAANGPAPAVDKPAAEPVVATKNLRLAPAATFSDLNGNKVSLAKLRGKVVFIDFWAPWCGPCREGLPFTERLSTTFKDKGLVVLGVSADPLKSVKAFMQDNNYTFNAMLDTEGFEQKFGVDGIPHTVVIDREGHIVAEEEGLAPQAETIKNLSRAGLDVKGFEPLHDPTLDQLLG